MKHPQLPIACSTFLVCAAALGCDSDGGSDDGADAGSTGSTTTASSGATTMPTTSGATTTTGSTTSGPTTTTDTGTDSVTDGSGSTGSELMVDYWCATNAGFVLGIDRTSGFASAQELSTFQLSEIVSGNGVVLAGASDELWRWVNGSWADTGLTDGFSRMSFGNGVFVAVDINAPRQQRTSTDGLTWTAPVATPLIEAPVFGAGRFVAISDDWISWSTDASTWTPTTTLVSARALAFGDGMFVGVGDQGVTVFSTDGGETWTENTPLAGGPLLLHVTHGGGRFVAGGTAGALWYSDDGQTWTPAAASLSTDGRVSGLAYSEPRGEFILVGRDAAFISEIRASTDGATWSEVALALGPDHFCTAVTPAP